MDQSLTNIIFDKKKVVTSVFLSQYLGITVNEACSMMREFYDKEKCSDGLWAAFVVKGSINKFGVNANATVLYSDTDLDKLKNAFEEVSSIELFSLQVLENKDLTNLLSVVRSQERESINGGANQGLIYSREVAEMARDLRCQIQNAKTDVLLAMKNILRESESSSSDVTQVDTKAASAHKRKTTTVNKSGAARQEKPGKPRALFSNDTRPPTSVIKSEEISPTEKERTTCLPDHHSPSSFKASKSSVAISNKDIFDDEVGDYCESGEHKQPLHESSTEESENSIDNSTKNAIPESNRRKRLNSMIRECSGERNVADNSKEVICSTKKINKSDEVPTKKKQTQRLLETYRDEDGFLVTKEVVKMVDCGESMTEHHSQSLCTSDRNKVNPVVSSKKGSLRSNTPKINTFFSKQ